MDSSLFARMTTTKTNPSQRFTPARLPWVLAAAALVVYLVTLNHWLALSSYTIHPYASNSLTQVAQVTGWTWQPALMEPLYWLLTYPLRFLPEARIPLALNLFAAVCATLTLWLLARSVAILPHDRTEDQRQHEKNSLSLLETRTDWMPPLFAVLVCGLQLSFWENATAASGEMLNLLLFAYVVRCLLEFRLDEQQRWLIKAMFVFAIGMTNNWGMIGYFPLFVAALIWLKGLSFFQSRFLGRMALWGFAGLLLYLLLPIVAAATNNVSVTFWQALKYNLGSQKGLLSAIVFNKGSLFLSDRPLWILGLPALLPLLIMAIRWPSYFGDPSKLGVVLATLIFHFFHAVLFGVCLWVMLDPPFSPRNMMFGTPLLSLYYLSALAVGYLAGYFALVFGEKPTSRSRPGLPSIPIINVTVLAITWAMLLIIPAALLYRNLPVIKSVNGLPPNKKQTPIRQFAEASAVALPPDGAVVLSDDSRKLTLVRSVLTEKGTADKYLFIETQHLTWSDYHVFLEKKQPQRWKNFVPKGYRGQVDDTSLVQILHQLSQSNSVYYLHPSFGYYFEAFWMEPRGMTYQLNSHQTNSLLAPPLPAQTIAYNESFWTKADQNAVGRLLEILKTAQNQKPANLAERLMVKARLKKQAPRDLMVIGSYYSRARNNWGVTMQKANDWATGQKHLEKALELNPDNLVSSINLDYSKQHQAGKTMPDPFTEDVEDLFGRYRSWDQLMNENGPFDEPRFCFEQGRVYVRGNLYRQAAHEFNRVRQLVPEHLQTRLWLAQVYVLTRWPDQALAIVNEIKTNAEKVGLSRTNDLEMMTIEGSALLSRGEAGRAAQTVQAALGRNPQNEEILASAVQLFMTYSQYTNALELIERQLKIDPNLCPALVNKGFALLQTKQYAQAIPPLTRALDIETNTTSELYQSALFNRAVAYLQSDNLRDAERDYETLQKSFPTAFKLYYGLAEIAYRKKDTNTALRQYNLYLANAPTNTAEAEFVRNRVKELKRGRP